MLLATAGPAFGQALTPEGQEEVISDIYRETDDAFRGMDDELSVDDDASASQAISSTVILSNDVYLNRISYQLSGLRFKVRGYDNYYQEKYLNGVRFNDQLRGVFNYASIGALNDVTRNGDVTNYDEPGLFTFGSLGGTENINLRAGNYARGGKVTATYTNRNYYLRGMASYSTGLNDQGWAFTACIGGRYSDKGAIEGTFYRNFSAFASVEKQWLDGKHSLSLVGFISPVERGQQGSTYREVYELTDNYQYNPNWGYQNGKRRNARVVKAFDPTGVLSYIYQINDATTFTAGLGYHFGRYGNTSLNWYNGADPRPDYYRYLPSYFDDEGIGETYAERWRSGDRSFTQIDWDGLYRANYLNNLYGNGSAIYMVEDRRSDLYEGTFDATINSRINATTELTGGVEWRSTQSRQYKLVDDLMGAYYVLDVDKFAEQDFPGDADALQNDLRNPNFHAREGDVFGYNFRLNIHSANAWLQTKHKLNRFEAFYGMKLAYTEFQRDGKMQNGRYPTSSLGKGRKHSFTDVMLKAGLNYKFNGRHFLTANISYGTEAPLPNNAYVSPRITDKTVSEMKSGRVWATDVNYVFSLPKAQGRISLYQTIFWDQMERSSYYDGISRTFINHVLTGMKKVHHGIEAAISYKPDSHWTIDAAGTVAEYFYANNPTGIINSENGKIDNVSEQVYMKNYYVGGTPQMAGTLGVRYFIKYWFLGASINGFGRNYVDIAPLRRIASNYTSVKPGNETLMNAYHKLTSQERLDGGFTIDLSVGKVIYLKGGHQLNINVSVNNLLNDRDICVSGYEQGRMDLEYPDRFGSKYYYLQGINCFCNIGYKF